MLWIFDDVGGLFCLKFQENVVVFWCIPGYVWRNASLWCMLWEFYFFAA